MSLRQPITAEFEVRSGVKKKMLSPVILCPSHFSYTEFTILQFFNLLNKLFQEPFH